MIQLDDHIFEMGRFNHQTGAESPEAEVTEAPAEEEAKAERCGCALKNILERDHTDTHGNRYI